MRKLFFVILFVILLLVPTVNVGAEGGQNHGSVGVGYVHQNSGMEIPPMINK